MPKTLLLADDSVVIQKLVGLSFANEDVKLVTTDNGDDALTRAREVSPDLILADVVMPGKNGYELCEAIKADPQLSHTPVLLLTGTFEAFDEDRARQVGSDGHITKPFEAQGLVDRVTELLARERPEAATSAPEPPAMPEAKAAASGTDDTYDFFDDDVSELAAPGAPAASPAVPAAASDDRAFEFGSSEFEPLGDEDDDPLSGESFGGTLDTGFDLDPAPRDDLTIAVGPEASVSPQATAAPPPDATVVVEDFATPNVPIDPPAQAESTLGDDLFGGGSTATDVPVAAHVDPSPVAIPTSPPAASREPVMEMPPEIPAVPAGADASSDNEFDFGFDSAPQSSPAATTIMPAPVLPEPDPTAPAPIQPPELPDAPMPTTVMQAPGLLDPDPVPTTVMQAPVLPESEAVSTAVMQAPVLPDAVADAMAAPESEDVTEVRPGAMSDADAQAQLAESVPEPMPAATSMEHAGDYDVSVSDLGQPVVHSMTAAADPMASAASPADLSPMLRDRIHETLEKVAWEAFADLSDTIVRQVLQRVESTVWEIMPQMAETLIQEEIRRMKGEDE